MHKQTALIIDDEADIRTLVGMTLERMGLESFAAASVAEARSLLQQRAYHFCITDMKLPDGNGLELIRYCQKNYPAMPIAMITAYGNLELGVNALKSGAFDVVAKPLDIDRLRQLVRDALKLSQTPAQMHSLPSDTGLLGRSMVMSQLRADVAQVARTQAPVFIQGEAGTGKELVARLIHHQSSQSNQSFVVVKCATANQAELEKTLFNPDDPQQSAVYRAHKGTLYMQDIDQLSLDLQARLLYILQEKRLAIPALGLSQELNIRLVSSSSANLEQLVQEHQFRQDLFYRVYVVTFTLLPLRERGEDIALLAKHFVRKFSEEWGGPAISMEKDAQELLNQYSFPGNIDELQAVLQRAVSLAENDSISVQDLRLPQSEIQTSSAPESASPPPIVTNNLEQYLENIEREALRQALEASRWNKTAAAAQLGISFRTMRYRCKKLGLD